MTELSSHNVERIFKDCLYKEGEDTSNMKIVEGIMHQFGFNPIRLKDHEEEIKEMLSQCGKDFFEDSDGKGNTFLSFCENDNGIQWTSFHLICEQLVCLGMAIDKVIFLMPKDAWIFLPGQMPYLQIKR